MKTFTLQQISEVIDYKYQLTRERFFYYFTHLYGFSAKSIERYWETFHRFPRFLGDPKNHELLEDMLEKVAEVVGILRLDDAIPYRVKQHTKPVRKQIYYRRSEGGESQVVEVDFNEPAQVVAYAEILRQGCEIVAALDFVEKISAGRDGYIDVYDGDIFATYEDSTWFRGREDTIIVCNGGTYRRLLYTAGKGYLRKGEPDYDMDNAYNSHVVTLCRNYSKIGNIYVDCSMLVDKADDDICADNPMPDEND